MKKEACASLGNKESECIANVFNNYFRLHLGYCHNFYRENSELFQVRVNAWKKLFNEVFEKKNNTPYIHYFTDHLAESIRKHGDVDVFNIQG